MLQKISEITGSPRVGQTVASSTGLQRGNAGSALTATDNARAWLLSQPSTEVADKALQTSLQSSLNVGVTVETRMMFPPEGKPYPVPSGSSVRALDAESVERAVARIEGAMTPPEKSRAEEWLVMLQAATAGGKRSEAGSAVALDLYAGALCRYPADVARDACQALATAKWFPTLGDLIAECDRIVGPRETMLQALKDWRPETERERLEAEADEWYRRAWQADQDKFALRQKDPDAASEAAEFSVIAWAKYREVSAKARQA